MTMRHLLILILALSSTPALAQSTDAERARVHFESGQRFYEAGQYRLAIDEFRAAYRLSGRPALLFNIAQAHRLAGDCAEALDAYRDYRELDGRAAERTNVDERIAEMERCVAEFEAEAAEPDTTFAPIPEPTPPPAPRAVHVSDGSARIWTGATLTVGGLVAVGAGAYFGVRAASDSDELGARYGTGGAWDADAAAMEDRIARDRRRAYVLAGAGTAGVVAGLYLYFSGREQAEYAERFAVTPRRGGAEVTWSWSF